MLGGALLGGEGVKMGRLIKQFRGAGRIATSSQAWPPEQSRAGQPGGCLT